jgi:hypothetical protein
MTSVAAQAELVTVNVTVAAAASASANIEIVPHRALMTTVVDLLVPCVTVLPAPVV